MAGERAAVARAARWSSGGGAGLVGVEVERRGAVFVVVPSHGVVRG